MYDMSIIKDYIEKGGGNFLTTKNCAVGATVTVVKVALDDETFDKAYIVCNGIYDPSGEEANVRLGIQNLKRIAETLGEDESKWVGKKLECLGYQDYPGLGQKGLLWRGMTAKAAAPAAVVSSSNTEKIRALIISAKPDLDVDAVNKLIEEERAKAGGLLTEEAAAYIVAGNLDVELK